MVNEFQLGAGVEFERIRRLTGYLGTMDRFNDAKKAEVADRVKHSFGGEHNENEHFDNADGVGRALQLCSTVS